MLACRPFRLRSSRPWLKSKPSAPQPKRPASTAPTIHHWIRNQPQFKAAVQTAQSEYAAEVNDSIHELAAHALLTLHDLLRDPATPHAVRLKTALAILQRPHAPNPGWNLPGPVELEPTETNRDATPIIVATEPAAPPTQQPAPALAPIARCPLCPCGSGRKYKRCCGPKRSARQ